MGSRRPVARPRFLVARSSILQAKLHALLRPPISTSAAGQAGCDSGIGALARVSEMHACGRRTGAQTTIFQRNFRFP